LFGPIVHESDQASLLEGAVAISRTGKVADQGFYNYDKQYGSYWIVVAALKLAGAKLPSPDVVLLGNALSVAFFNVGLVLLVVSIASSTALVLLACLLFSPSFFAHSPFLAGNYLSAFFLLAQFVALGKFRSIWVPLILAFCATACRADAVLAQSILLWCTTDAETLPQWAQDKRLWGCVSAAGTALLLGKAMTSADANTFGAFNIFLNWKILIVYSLFGLGAGVGVLFLCVAALSREIAKAKDPSFSMAGLASLILPFAYYVLNLYSTRHWTVALAAFMCFVASDRGGRILQGTLTKDRLRTVLLALLIAAGLPVFFGFHFAAPNAPRLTMSRPTLVPSADGLIPLGSYLSHAWGWSRDQRQIPDHNQATWLAALAADFESSTDSPVQLLVSPLASILQLAASLRGYKYQLVEVPHMSTDATYTEFRALRKAPMSHSEGKLSETLVDSTVPCGVEFASPLIAGEAIVKLTPAKNDFAKALDVLRRAFGGNDYHFLRLNTVRATSLGGAQAGHQMALFSTSPFTLSRGTETLAPERNREIDGRDYYLLTFVVKEDESFVLNGGVDVAAVSILPAFMSVASY
jgi:hypothetical protein